MVIYMRDSDKKTFFKVEKSLTDRSEGSKNFSRSQKVSLILQKFYNLSPLCQNAVWTNSTSGKKNLNKTNTLPKKKPREGQ